MIFWYLFFWGKIDTSHLTGEKTRLESIWIRLVWVFIGLIALSGTIFITLTPFLGQRIFPALIAVMGSISLLGFIRNVVMLILCNSKYNR